MLNTYNVKSGNDESIIIIHSDIMFNVILIDSILYGLAQLRTSSQVTTATEITT